MSERVAVACSPQGPCCSVCGDDAVEMRVTVVLPAGLARVSGAPGEMEVATDLVGEVAVGDRLMVHQGFAIARVP